MSLTPKQAAFVREYLVDLNATQAAIRAGYSPRTAASIGEENLRKPDIKAAIEAAMAERAKRTEITADRVVAELAKIGFSDIRDILRWETVTVDDDGGDAGGDQVEESKEAQPHGGALKRVRQVSLVHLLGSDEIHDDAAAAISEIKQTAQGVSVKVHDKRAALVDLGRHLGMFKQKVELTDPDGANPFAGLMEMIASGGRPRPGS